MPEERTSVSVIYEKHNKSNTVPVTGAYGGPIPNGDAIMVHFFIEYPTIPNSTELEVKDGKIINPQTGKNISRGDVTREVQFSAHMTAKSAIVIGNWLIEKGNMLLGNKEEE
ncbi:MAG TPA: hypothetical protein VKA26_01175 [Ignavibacteriaceae bacterium]|nr:hypothetical protein [Ignavibacteriaceae bacterium]